MIIRANAAAIPLADESVQCVVTSPPYWGLRKYAGEQEFTWPDGWRGGFGLEPTVEMYVQHSVLILREVRRVLRKDGVCFWNLGDSYHNGDKGGYTKDCVKAVDSLQRSNLGENFEGAPNRQPQAGLKPKDLCLIPWRVALAAQADGWWVRSVIIWAKPNPMPESCRDRPTDAYEPILMLTKSQRYFWDGEAVKEAASDRGRMNGISGRSEKEPPDARPPGSSPNTLARIDYRNVGRNLRNVWTFPTQAYPEAHFATFPEELPRRCIKAATSERGCCQFCGAPWERVTRQSVRFESGSGKAENQPDGKWRDDAQAASGDYDIRMGPVVDAQTIGWRPSCRCHGQHGKTVPCIVLDPFGGSGTTAKVAMELNRRVVSLDLAYHDMAKKRTSAIQPALLQI